MTCRFILAARPASEARLCSVMTTALHMVADSHTSVDLDAQEKRKKRAQEEAKRLGMEHLTKKGQKLGHGPQQPTGV